MALFANRSLFSRQAALQGSLPFLIPKPQTMMKLVNVLIYSVLGLWFCTISASAQPERNAPPNTQQVDCRPSPRPSRILLSWEGDPRTSATVAWRTDTTVVNAKAELALADPSPAFNDYETDHPATTQSVRSPYYPTALYHKARFSGLQPNTLYAYRVGDGKHWSEWFQFRTAPKQGDAFRFIYMGDAQNKVFSHWSRAMRAAYAQAPDAAFVLHVGDLINHADNDYEWQEWFSAGSFIHSTIPVVALPGNHEYNKNKQGKKVSFSRYWSPQFHYPDNGPDSSFQDQAYYIDYQHLRLIVLNSNRDLSDQSAWLDTALANSPKRWNMLAFHHPVYSASKGRVNEGIIRHWLPIIQKHNVDLVLQGHDHTYARGKIAEASKQHGTVYVVSVGGEKMYHLSDQEWMHRKAENTQFYQVIKLDGNKLTYTCHTTTGEVYDAFELRKKSNGQTRLKPLPTDYPKERRFSNTLKEQ